MEFPGTTPFRLRKHSSRRGWRVTRDSLAQNPFTSDFDAPLWKLRDGRMLSLRAIAAETLTRFRRRIRQISDRGLWSTSPLFSQAMRAHFSISRSDLKHMMMSAV